MISKVDGIARAVQQQFDALPAKRKPAVRDNGLHEWVPLSGIVVEAAGGQLHCVALATGMKCLPANKLSLSNGVGIHDWHAEVLALRAFNRYLLDECTRMLDVPDSSEFVRFAEEDVAGVSSRTRQPFCLKQGLKLHMYCSEAPCGDASMELTMAAQEDATPWTQNPDTPTQEGLLGRGDFSQLGVVRRKPARADAPSTMSKSCSDKIASKEFLSLLSSVTSIFIDPSTVYLETLVLPMNRYHEGACKRAFGSEGRLKAMSGIPSVDGYEFRPFKVETTSLEFAYAKPAVERRSQNIAASNIAALWSRSGFQETILNGVVQGRKAFETKGASRLSRRAMWLAAKELQQRLLSEEDKPSLDVSTYRELKLLPILGSRVRAKDALRTTALTGWKPNEGDSDFELI